MKNVSDIIKRLKKVMPEHIKPTFDNGTDLIKWHKKQGICRATNIYENNRISKCNKMFRESGISPLHKDCSFNNYVTKYEGQLNALNLSRQYVKNFDNSITNFIFSGYSGTGKNHLAAAICKELLSVKKSTLIISVADILSKMKNSFRDYSFDDSQSFLQRITNVDLLILDEVGLHSHSRYLQMILDQIVNRRSSYKLPIGMISNLNFESMTKFLSERVMDRMRFGNGLYVIFNWVSWRSDV